MCITYVYKYRYKRNITIIGSTADQSRFIGRGTRRTEPIILCTSVPIAIAGYLYLGTYRCKRSLTAEAAYYNTVGTNKNKIKHDYITFTMKSNNINRCNYILETVGCNGVSSNLSHLPTFIHFPFRRYTVIRYNTNALDANVRAI